MHCCSHRAAWPPSQHATPAGAALAACCLPARLCTQHAMATAPSLLRHGNGLHATPTPAPPCSCYVYLRPCLRYWPRPAHLHCVNGHIHCRLRAIPKVPVPEAHILLQWSIRGVGGTGSSMGAWHACGRVAHNTCVGRIETCVWGITCACVLRGWAPPAQARARGTSMHICGS